VDRQINIIQKAALHRVKRYPDKVQCKENRKSEL